MNQHVASEEGIPRASWTDRYLPNMAHTPQAKPLVDTQMIRGFLWRERYVLVGVTALALLAGFVLTLLATPIFKATSSVRVDLEQGEILDESGLGPQVSMNQIYGYIATLAKVVESRTSAYQVVDLLKLDDNAEFLGFDPAERPEGVSEAKWAEQRREIAASVAQSALETNVPTEERLMSITIRLPDAALAARVANGYAENFLTDDLRRSVQKNSYAQAYLAKEIEDTRERLDEAERAALGYARANGIVGESLIASDSAGTTDGGAAPQTITAGNLASISGAVSSARAQRIAAQQRWLSIAGAPAATLPEVQQSGAIQNLVSRRTEIAAQLAELRTRYGENYPQVAELSTQIATLDRQINQLGSDIKQGIRKRYEVAAREEAALQSELGRVSGATLDEQERRVAFNQLNSQVISTRSQLQALLDRYNQISSSANVQPSTITMLDKAIVPNSPDSPNLFTNLLIALVLGSGLAIALAVLRETFDDRLRSAADVERKLGLPLLGITPLVDKGTQVEDSAQLSEAYSSIRASLGFTMPRRDHNIIQLTSSQSVEGKSTTAIALARKYAQLGRKVLLVEADFRRPSLSKQVGIPRPAAGFGQVLSGEISLEEALISQSQANLDVLPVGPVPSTPVEIIASPQFEEFFVRHRDRYSLILIDGPPVMGLADAPLIARVADGVMFIVESNRSHFGQSKTALRRLRDAGANVLGVVLTKFRSLEAGESYSYGYDYYTYGEERT